MEHQWMDFNAEGCDVFLFELSCHVALDECCLSGTAIADQNALECRDITFCCHLQLLLICERDKEGERQLDGVV
jgi:hypothetical protein